MSKQREALELARDAINAEIAAYSDDFDTQNHQLHRAIAAIDAALAEVQQPVASHPDPARIAALSFAWQSGYKQAKEEAAFAAPVAAPAPAQISDTDLRCAIARGWCHPANSSKTMDIDLAMAIEKEVRAVLAAGGK